MIEQTAALAFTFPRLRVNLIDLRIHRSVQFIDTMSGHFCLATRVTCECYRQNSAKNRVIGHRIEKVTLYISLLYIHIVANNVVKC